MLSSSQRLAVRVHRRETLGWLALLSLALHLTLFLSLLIIPTMQPPTDASGPLSVEVIMEGEPTGPASEPPAPIEAIAAPIAPAAPAQQAELPPPTPAPAPDVPPPAPAQQAETPPPTPAQQAEVTSPTPAPTPVPEVLPPTPAQQAEPPPPMPAPAPMPLPPPSSPVARAHPPPAPPQRVASRPAATRAPVNPAGEAAHATAGQNAASHASGANNGAAWMGRLKQWWDRNSFYPKEASQTNEGGNVKVRIAIASDGQVTSIVVVQGSGSSVLDAAAVAVFRNAHLPPFPPGTPAQPADVVVTLHYRPADGGG